MAKYVNRDGLLVADPVFQFPDVWGTIAVRGRDIVPSATYTVEAKVGPKCRAFMSAPASDTTVLWGDTVGFFTGTEWTPPDGVVDILDVLGILDKFRNLPTALPIYQVDLIGINAQGIACGLDQRINILEAVVALDAIAGSTYVQSTNCPVPCP